MVALGLKHFHDLFLVLQKVELQTNNFLKSIRFKFHFWNLYDIQAGKTLFMYLLMKN